MGEEEMNSLNQAIALLSSLISLSHSIKIFPSKWHFIRNKLQELFSNLAAIENCEESNEASSLSNAMDSILSTLKTCDDLARRCLDFSFTGKLQMQSDLDQLSAKLEIHINSLSNIYAAGLLTQSHAIVVSRPSASASREDMTFYINDLLTRFKIGGGDVKKQALVAFNEAILESDRYVKIAVEIDGFVNFLVKFLDCCGDCEIQPESAKAVCAIAGFESCRGSLITAGIIAPLIRVLELGKNEVSKNFAARCLMKVTENSDNAWAVSAHGGVTALLKICGNDSDCGSDLVSLACSVLKNVVGVEEIRRFMVEDGAIPVLVELVRSSTDETTSICSIDLLQSVAYRDESVMQMVVKEGAIGALMHTLDPTVSVSVKAREVALRGIMNICENYVGVLMDSAFMNHMLYLLQYGEFALQELALKAAFWLCGASEEAKKAMGDAGFIPVLVKFLNSKLFEIRELAGETLCSMMVVPKNRKRFVQSDEHVGMLLQMLDPGQGHFGNRNNNKVLVGILMKVASSHGGRKKIVSSEHLKNIEKLAEAEVLDAKKVVRKLSCNRFRSMFNGLWHSSS